MRSTSPRRRTTNRFSGVASAGISSCQTAMSNSSRVGAGSSTVDVVGEYGGTGSVLAHYAYGLGLASRVGADGTPDFYDFDGTGSTAGLTGASGSYINAYSYLPFGEAQGAPQATV